MYDLSIQYEFSISVMYQSVEFLFLHVHYIRPNYLPTFFFPGLSRHLGLPDTDTDNFRLSQFLPVEV